MHKTNFKFDPKFNFDNNPGLYLTIIVHLIALIIFLCIQIHTITKEETTFVLDFTKEEELEKQRKEQEMKESVSRELDAMLASAVRNTKVRNTVVNSADLKDSKNIGSKEIDNEMKRLQERMDANRRMDEQLDKEFNYARNSGKKEKKKTEKYTGPSVVKWTLEGRRVMSMPIPAYKCEGSGLVTVAISVNRNGYVKAAYIVDTESSTDSCLREYAMQAARKSRFNASGNAPERQAGTIVYSFVAQ